MQNHAIAEVGTTQPRKNATSHVKWMYESTSNVKGLFRQQHVIGLNDGLQQLWD
jgi:hypothetical protein